MNKKNIGKAIKEVNEIMKYIPAEEKNKINKKFLDFLNKIEDKTYDFNFEPEKDLLEQNLLEETKMLLGIIYRNYWCSKEEQEEIDKVLRENEEKYVKEINEKYNQENLFEKKKLKSKEIENNLPVVVEEKMWFNRLIGFIKKYIFKRKDKK